MIFNNFVTNCEVYNCNVIVLYMYEVRKECIIIKKRWYKSDNYIVVDANGVGYMIYTSLNSMQNAGEVGKKITIYTYLRQRT